MFSFEDYGSALNVRFKNTRGISNFANVDQSKGSVYFLRSSYQAKFNLFEEIFDTKPFFRNLSLFCLFTNKTMQVN